MVRCCCTCCCPPEALTPYVFIPHPLYTAPGLLAANLPTAEGISNTSWQDPLATAGDIHQTQTNQPADYLEMANLFQSLLTGNDSMADTLPLLNDPPLLRCHECDRPAGGETSYCPAAASCQRIHCMICGQPNPLFCSLHPDVQYHLATFPNRPLTSPVIYGQHRPIIPGMCLACTCRQPGNLSTLDVPQPLQSSQLPTTTTTTTTRDCEDARRRSNHWNGDKDDQGDGGEAAIYKTPNTLWVPSHNTSDDKDNGPDIGRKVPHSTQDVLHTYTVRASKAKHAINKSGPNTTSVLTADCWFCKLGLMSLPMFTTLLAAITNKPLYLSQSQLAVISLLALGTPTSARPCACGTCQSEWFTWGWWCPIAWQFVLLIGNNTTHHNQWQHPTTINDLPTFRLPDRRTSVLSFEAQTGYNGIRFGRFLGKSVFIRLWAEVQCTKYLCPEGVLIRARWFREDDDPLPKKPKLLLPIASLVNGPYNTDAETDDSGSRDAGSSNDHLSIAFSARPSRTVTQSTATHHAIFNSSSSSSASSSSSTRSSATRNNMMPAWVIGVLITIGTSVLGAHGTHHNTHLRTAAPHISTPIMILAALMSTTPVEAVNCACGDCENYWFLQGWICQVTFHMQTHPEAYWTDQWTHADISLGLMGEPTPWHLAINNVHGTTMYSITGQCVHLPPGVYGATDILLALLLLPLCGTPCPSPHDPLPALLNTSSSASGDISLNDVENPPQETQQHSAGSSQDVAALHSATLRPSPRLYFLMLLLLTLAHYPSSSNHVSRKSDWILYHSDTLDATPPCCSAESLQASLYRQACCQTQNHGS